MKNPNGFGGIRKLNGNRRRPWQVVVTSDWQLVDGKPKQVQKSVGYTATREEALILLAEYNKNPYDVTKDMTFEDVYKALDKSRMSTKTLNAITTAYNRCKTLHKMKFREIKKIHLQKVANSLVDFSPATLLQVRQLWKLMFNFGMENDIIIKDYSQFVRFYSDYEPKGKNPFTAEEVALFSDDLVILCYTGLRISEYLSLTIDDIKDGCLYVLGTKTASANRIVPIHDKIADKLNQRLTEGNMMNYHDYLMKSFIPEMKSLGIEGHRIHDCRRSFATFASRSGMDPAITKRILGHKLGDITEDVYISKNVEDLKNEMKKFKLL